MAAGTLLVQGILYEYIHVYPGGGGPTIRLTNEEIARIPVQQLRPRYINPEFTVMFLPQPGIFLSERLPTVTLLNMTICPSNRAQALAMALHPRLGQDSPLHNLDQELLEKITAMSLLKDD
jgi:hypothetical protein